MKLKIPWSNYDVEGDFTFGGVKYKYRARQFMHHSRWSVDFFVVHEDEQGKYWAYYEEVPATEYQDYDRSEIIELMEVAKVPSTEYIQKPQIRLTSSNLVII